MAMQKSSEAQLMQSCVSKVKSGTVRPFELRVVAFELRDLAPRWTPQSLQQLAEMVIERAIDKAGACAEQCAVLAAALVPILPTHKQSVPCAVSRTHSHRRVDFRMLLLNAVQAAFDKGLQPNLSTGLTTEQQCGSQHERNSGLMLFIGHLLRHGLLTERIILACVGRLLQGEAPVQQAHYALILMDLTAHMVRP